MSSSRVIPNFVKARTAQGVRRLYLREQTKRGAFLKPISINFVNGEWYIWFTSDLLRDDVLIKEAGQ